MSYTENRRAKRVNIDMTMTLYDITTNSVASSEVYPAEVDNISMSGIGFIAEGNIQLNAFYKANLVFPNKDSFDVVIQVIRCQENMFGENMYGGIFLGISESEKSKIEVYRLFKENNKK